MSDFTATYERYFSLEGDFMNYKVDDLLYGYLFYHATCIESKEGWDKKCKYYLRTKNYNKMRKDLKKLLDVDTKTLKRHLDLLIERGLLKEENMEFGKNKNSELVYIFKTDDFIGKYQKVNFQILEYLIRTGNKHKIKIYIYLLDKFQWKKREKSFYLFTKVELIEAIGYSVKNISSTDLGYGLVSDNLDSLYREGAIQFEVVKFEGTLENGKKVPIERLKLVYVAESIDGLRPVPETK